MVAENPELPASAASPLSTEALSRRPASDAEPWVKVGTFESVLHAETARGVLVAADIEARLVDDHVAGVAPHLTIALGGVGLEVRASTEGTARALIEDLETPANDGGAHAVVFRIRSDQRGLFAIVGFVASWGAALLLAGALPPVAVALLVALATATGLMVGKNVRRDYCSKLGCATLLPEPSQTCPGCGGRIVGELDDPAERLEAIERYEESLTDGTPGEAPATDGAPTSESAAPTVPAGDGAKAVTSRT